MFSSFAAAVVVVLISAAGAVAAPAIAGFDRFHGDKAADAAALGRLLINELNCAACHAHAGPVDAGLSPNPAPLLGDVGARLKPQWIRAYLKDVHKTKPGARMPGAPDGIPAAELEKIEEAIVHYLATLQPAKPIVVQGKAGDGAKVFNTIGCAACHAPIGGEAEVKNDKGNVPLADLKAKYLNGSALAAYLLDPQKIHPGGRMPKMNLSNDEAVSIAAAFGLSAGTVRVGVRASDDAALKKAGAAELFVNGLDYELFEGAWDKLPDFNALKPKKTGQLPKFTVGPGEGGENFGLRLRGYIDVPRDGVYTFYAHSDDGSRIIVGRDVVVDNDGIHGGVEKAGTIELKKGKHAFTVEYFEAQGGEELRISIEGPKVPKQEIPSGIIHRLKSGPFIIGEDAKPVGDEVFMPDPDLAKAGKVLFNQVGCASCHALNAGDKLAAMELPPKPLAQLKGSKKGTLAEGSSGLCPQYQLSAPQKAAIHAALETLGQPAQLTAGQRVDRTMTALNCYACHARQGKGGPEEGHKKSFTGTYEDLADEGRLPPHLGDVGQKLLKPWLAEILSKGTKVRPYMNARMPVFAESLTKHLIDDFTAADTLKNEPAYPEVSPKDAMKHGRVLVGTGGMACVQCHVFNGEKSLGLPAMDLALMPQRLQRDWFGRYLLTPAQLRPGTRMPQFWPNGVSVRPEILDGKTDVQIEAIWQYLSRGKNAPLPPGLGSAGMMLVADTEAVMYRNFIQGASPRGIGVGYPEKVNICWDANTLRLAMIWHGDFIDASKHWKDRGPGFQNPAGYGVVHFPEAPPLALLGSESTPWPDALRKNNVVRADGFQFKGYILDKLRRPTFMYAMGDDLGVHDFYSGAEAAGDKADATLKRKLEIATSAKVENLYHRVAVGTIEAKADGSYKIGDLVVKITSDAKPLVRTVAGKQELIVPVLFNKTGKSTIVTEYIW